MEEELEKLENGLRRIPPAAAPPELMERLRAATSRTPPVHRAATVGIYRRAGWRGWLGWAALAPAAAILLLWLAWRPSAEPPKAMAARSKIIDSAGIKADDVSVGHSLMASFDTVAQLPGGEPVRFRCREWQDEVVIHDDAHGVEISRSTPRVEVIPVRFETY